MTSHLDLSLIYQHVSGRATPADGEVITIINLLTFVAVVKEY